MSRDERERERFSVKKLLKLKNKQGFNPYKQQRYRIIIEFIKGSFLDLIHLQKTFKERAHVFHAASVASVPEVFVS
jgi:hypothetical protein